MGVRRGNRSRWIKIALLLIVPVALGLFVRERASWRPIVLRQGGGSVQSLVFSTDGRDLAVGESNSGAFTSQLQLWNVQRKVVLHRLGISQPLYKTAFSPDGRLMAGGTENGDISLWKVDGTFEGESLDIPSGVGPLLLLSSNELVTLGVLSISDDRQPRVALDYLLITWDLLRSKEIDQVRLHVEKTIIPKKEASKRLANGMWKFHSSAPLIYAIAPDRQTIAVGQHYTIEEEKRGEEMPETLLRPEVLLFDARTGRLRHHLDTDGKTQSDLVFSTDGTLLAATGGGAVRVWDTNSGTVRHILREGGSSSLSRSLSTGQQIPSGIHCAAFSPNGDLLAGGANGGVLLWEMPSGRQLRVLETKGHRVSALAFSPDGRTLATGDANGTLMLWRVR